MVRMQIRDDTSYSNRETNNSDSDMSSPMRSSLSWDKTKQPRRSILKHKSRRRHPIITNTNTLIIPLDDPIQRVTSASSEIQDMLNKLTLNNDNDNVNLTKMNEDNNENIEDQIIVKASKLYGRPYENCHQYDVSTSITIRYGISSQRISRLRNHQALISFMDIYDLPTLLREVISSSVHQIGVFQDGYINNDFYCNAYWAVRLTDTIVELVFEKLGISLDEDITYNPRANMLQSVRSIAEITHILKDQISVCDWLTTTIGPNYSEGNVPYQLGPLLLRELQKLVVILTSANDMWIEHAARVLC